MRLNFITELMLIHIAINRFMEAMNENAVSFSCRMEAQVYLACIVGHWNFYEADSSLMH